MNWEAIGSVAETLGALGVMASLIYLAVQLRQSKRDVRADALQQLGRDYAAHGSIVMQDENVTAFIKGLKCYSNLTATERVKFDYCATGFINIVESALYHGEAGRLDEVVVMLKEYLGPRVFAYSGFRAWWEHGRKAGFGEPTQAWVDEQIIQNKDTVGFWEYQHGADA